MIHYIIARTEKATCLTSCALHTHAHLRWSSTIVICTMVHFVPKLYTTLTWNDTNLTQKCDEHVVRSEPSRPCLPLRTWGLSLHNSLMVMRCRNFGGRAFRSWKSAQRLHFWKKQKLTMTEARGLRATLFNVFLQTFEFGISHKQGSWIRS